MLLTGSTVVGKPMGVPAPPLQIAGLAEYAKRWLVLASKE
jgi:hypothetical protein